MVMNIIYPTSISAVPGSSLDWDVLYYRFLSNPLCLVIHFRFILLSTSSSSLRTQYLSVTKGCFRESQGHLGIFVAVLVVPSLVVPFVGKRMSIVEGFLKSFQKMNPMSLVSPCFSAIFVSLNLSLMSKLL
jgi:hypothetical protein